MRYRQILALTAATMILSAPAIAHHGFSSVFDRNKVRTLQGVVTKVDWMNPHPYVYLNMEDAHEPSVQSWAVELPDLNKLKRYGLEKEMIEIGKEITLVAYLSRADGDLAYLNVDATLPVGYAKAQRFARAIEVVFANGKRIQTPG
jgi:hypothetical protein